MPNSLYLKLVAVLLLLFSLLAFIIILIAWYSAPLYQQEVSQRLNRDLASYIVNEHVLIENGQVNTDNLKQLFHKAMIINPSLELYVLDDYGKVIAHSLPKERIIQDHVSLEPVNQFLAGSSDNMIQGDDPTDNRHRKSFTVAPIEVDGKREGYIYAVFGSKLYESISEMLQESYILQWSSSIIIAIILFTFTAASVMFFLLMKKLRLLNTQMQQFRDNKFTLPVKVTGKQNKQGDEIDSLSATFSDMAEHIHTQMLQLKETDALRRELVANVSHDLRTPLASMKGYIETLKIKSEQLEPEEIQKYLDITHRNSEHLSAMVEELFELAKLDSSEIKPHYELFSLAELAHDVSHKFQLRASRTNISIDVITDDTVRQVSADLGMMERVLDNLIDNSIKHTPQGGRIQLTVNQKDNDIQVSVSDTGFGIDKKDLPHVFKRFYRKKPDTDDSSNHNSTTSSNPGRGLGLGLAIASRIIELHGSRLLVNSVLMKGTTFEFSLPATT